MSQKNVHISCLCLAALAWSSSVNAAPPVPASAKPASASSTASKQALPGAAIADLQAAIAATDAWKSATQQQRTVYKAQLADAEAKRTELRTKLKPMLEKLQRDRTNPKITAAAIMEQEWRIRQIEIVGQREINNALEPVRLSQAYISEQFTPKATLAVKNAMAKSKIAAVFQPQSLVAFDNLYNLTPLITQELNVLLPTVQVSPPPGWTPQSQRQAVSSTK